MKKLRDRKGVSPVIATVILVAVTIVVAVAVAYWMGSIAGLYTRSENLEIQSSYMTKKTLNSSTDSVPSNFDNKTGWEITLIVKNSGSRDATVTEVFINDQPISTTTKAASANVTNGQPVRIPVQTGKTVAVILYVLEDEAAGFTAGTRIEVKLHTAANMDYPRMMPLS